MAPDKTSFHLDRDFLADPVEVLLCSLEDDTPSVNIMQAYATLYARFQAGNVYSWPREYIPPALQPMKDSSSRLIQVIRRDITRAQKECYLPDRLPSGTSTGQGDISHTVKENTLATAALNDYALRLLIQLFSHRALCSLISDVQWDNLLGDLLSLVSAPPTFLGSYRLRSLATFAFRHAAINAPCSVLTRKAGRIMVAAQNILENDQYSSCDAKALHDVLHIASTLLRRDPQESLPYCEALLSPVLKLLLSPFPSIRHHTALTVESYAMAVARSTSRPSNLVISAISERAKSFLKQQARSYYERTLDSEPNTLAHMFEKCILISTSVPGDNASWALSVASSLVVLCGRRFWFLPNVNRMLWRPVRLLHTLHQKDKSCQAKHTNPEIHMSRAFLWALHDLRAWQQHRHIDVNAMEGSACEPIARRALSVCRAGLHDSCFVALIATILGITKLERAKEADVRWTLDAVIDIMTEMMSHPRQDVRRDGCAALAQLVTGTVNQMEDSSNLWCPSRLLCSDILYDSPRTSEDVHLPSVSISAIHPLSDSIILQHWDSLMALWASSIRHRLTTRSLHDLDIDLRTWHALLSYKARTPQDGIHPTSSDSAVDFVMSVMTAFLSELADSPAELLSLQLIQRLWSVCKNVFDDAWLALGACRLLDAVIRREHALASLDIQETWSNICSDFILRGLPKSISIAFKQDFKSEITRPLWRAAVAGWVSCTLRLNHNDAIACLLVPLQSWKMDSEEIELWVRLLRWTTRAAAPGTVIEALSTGFPRAFELGTTIAVLSPLLDSLDIADVNGIPRILKVIDDALVQAYVRRDLKAVQVLAAICQILQFMRPPDTHLLISLQRSLQVWIKDEDEVVDADEYNAHIMGLYRAVLELLTRLPPTMEDIAAHTPLLASAFHRMPQPALGPDLFKAFFDQIHPTLGVHASTYPIELHSCISAAFRFFGDTPPSGVESQEDLPKLLPAQGTGTDPFHSYVPSVLSHQDMHAVSSLKREPHLLATPPSSQPQMGPDPTMSKYHQAVHMGSTTLLATPTEDQSGVQDVSYEFPSPSRFRRALAFSSQPTPTKSAGGTSTMVPSPSAPVLQKKISKSTRKPAQRTTRMILDYVEVPSKASSSLQAVMPKETTRAKKTSTRQQESELSAGQHEDYDTWEVTPATPVTRGIIRRLEKEEIVPETPEAANFRHHPNIYNTPASPRAGAVRKRKRELGAIPLAASQSSSSRILTARSPPNSPQICQAQTVPSAALLDGSYVQYDHPEISDSQYVNIARRLGDKKARVEDIVRKRRRTPG